LLVTKSAHEDILTVKVDPKESVLNTTTFEDDFRTFFRDICTVKIDRIEFVKQGTLKDNRLIVDEREWK
jgi:hypothetical protein